MPQREPDSSDVEARSSKMAAATLSFLPFAPRVQTFVLNTLAFGPQTASERVLKGGRYGTHEI